MSIIYRENDNVYMNITITHPQVEFIGSGTPPLTTPYNEIIIPAEYNVTKTLPILEKASEYYISVIRFDIPLDATPITIMPIVTNQTDPNLTALIIGITYNGTNYPVSLIFIPESNSPPPVQNLPTQVITDYYFLFTYQTLIQMFNTALATAWSDSGLMALYMDQNPPFFVYDPTTQLISLIVYEIFNNVAPANPYIFWNGAAQHYLNGFQIHFIGWNQPQGKDFQLVLDNDIGSYVSNAYYLPGTDPYTTDPTYFKFTQDFVTIGYWSSLRKIIIATNTIPINNEYIPSNTGIGGIAASFPILTDFIPSIEQSGQSRSIAYYYPTSQYRLVDLISELPLQKIDLKIFWEDTLGNLYPLYITMFQQASIKLGFFRKTLYKSMNQLLMK